MKIKQFNLFLKLTFFLASISAPVLGKSHEHHLFNNLFKNYEKHIRPVRNQNETVEVTIKHTLSQILKIEQHNELLVSSGWCSLRWRDTTLTWDPKEYDGIKLLNLRTGLFWTPDIVLYNDVQSDKAFGDHIDQGQNRLTLNYKGDIVWGLKTKFVTKCHFDVTYYPFNKQSCKFVYGSWSFEKGRIDISPNSMIKVDEQGHKGKDWWHLIGLNQEIIEKNYSDSTYQYIHFTINFERRCALIDLANVVIPPLIIGSLVPLSFLLPAISGERLALSITLLLAMLYFFINVAYMIPDDNVSIPIIYKFFAVTIIEIVGQIVAIIFSMRLYHKNTFDPPMSSWVRHYLLDMISFSVGVRYEDKLTKMAALTTDEMEEVIEATLVLKKSEGCENDDGNYAERKELRVIKEWRIVALTVDRILFILSACIWISSIMTFLLRVNQR